MKVKDVANIINEVRENQDVLERNIDNAEEKGQNGITIDVSFANEISEELGELIRFYENMSVKENL